MIIYPKLKEYFDDIRKSILSKNADFATEAMIELAVFCTYIIKIDNKITSKEIKAIQIVVGFTITKEVIEGIIRRTNWDMFKYNFPIILQVTIVSDLEAGRKLSDPNSKAAEYLNNMRLLGTVIANLGGMTKEKNELAKDYTESLGKKAVDYFSDIEQNRQQDSKKISKVIENSLIGNDKPKIIQRNKNKNPKTKETSPDFRTYFKSIFQLFSEDQESTKRLIIDITKFCLYVINSERTVTDRETQFLETITMTPTTKEKLEELKLSIEFADYITETPFFLDLSITADLQNKLNEGYDEDKDSITNTYLYYLAELGKAFSELEASSHLAEERIKAYCDFLVGMVSDFMDNYMEQHFGK